MSDIWPIAKSHLSLAAKCTLSTVGLVLFLLGGAFVFISLGIDSPEEADERDRPLPQQSFRGG